MTFRLSLLIDADGRIAIQQLNETGKAAEVAGGKIKGMGKSGSVAEAEIAALKSEAAQLRSTVDTLTAAEARATAAMAEHGRQATVLRGQLVGVGNAGTLGASGVANLTAQFNDIGVMLAAGQSPLQLAIQQGTQITQVIGPLGAAGAVRALGAGLLSMLNPLSLITIGSIAAGAALFQWLTSAGEEAETFEDVLGDLGKGIDGYAKAAAAARVPTADLRKEFGTASEEARLYLERVEQIKRAEEERRLGSGLKALSGESGINLSGSNPGQPRLQEIFEIGQRRDDREGRGLLGQVFADYQALEAAADQSVDAQIAALDRLYRSVETAAARSGATSQQEEAVLQRILTLRLEAARLQAETGANQTRDLAAPYVEYYAARLQGERYLANARAAELAEQSEIYGLYARTRSEAEAAQVTAQTMLTTLAEENALRDATLRYGEDSVEVANLRTEAERRAFEEILSSLDASESLKEALQAAFEEGQALAALDMASGIGAAGTEARRLAEWLGVSLSTASRLAAMGPQGTPQAPNAGRGGDPRLFGGSFYDWNNQEGTAFLDSWKAPKKPRVGGGRKGKGTSPEDIAKKQAEALKKLIEREQLELDILRETDPVQKEMLRNREALKGATEAERETVRGLIAERQTEARQIEELTERQEFFRQTTFASLRGLIFEGQTLGDVFENLSLKLAEAAFEAAALGTGPLAGLLGTSSGGGFLGGIFGALVPGGSSSGGSGGPIPAKADGGMIYGPGDGRSDDVLMFGSSGEFVANARATRRYRHILEAMNAGMDIPGLAAGGPIGSAAPSSYGGGGLDTRPLIQIVNQSSTPISGDLEETVAPGGRRQTRLVLADAVGDALTLSGGGGKRAMRNAYGLSQRGTLR